MAGESHIIKYFYRNGKCYSISAGNQYSEGFWGTGQDGNITVPDGCTCYLCAKVYNLGTFTVCPTGVVCFCGEGVPVIKTTGDFINCGCIDLRKNGPILCNCTYTLPFNLGCAHTHCGCTPVATSDWNRGGCGGASNCVGYFCRGGNGGGYGQRGCGDCTFQSKDSNCNYNTIVFKGGATCCGNGGGGASDAYGKCGRKCGSDGADATESGGGNGGSGAYGYNYGATGAGGGGYGHTGPGGNGGNGSPSYCKRASDGGDGGGSCLYNGGNGGNGGNNSGGYSGAGGYGGKGGDSYCGNGGDGGTGGSYVQGSNADWAYNDGGNGGNSIYGNGGNGGRGGNAGHGGCTCYGNGGNGGDGCDLPDDCYMDGYDGGNGGFSAWGNGGNGGRGGNTPTSSCEGGGGNGGSGGNTGYGRGGDGGNGGTGHNCKNSSYCKYKSNGGNGGSALGGMYGLVIQSQRCFKNNCIFGKGGSGGNGGAGGTWVGYGGTLGDAANGGNGGDAMGGAEIVLVYGCCMIPGTISVDNGTPGTGGAAGTNGNAGTDGTLRWCGKFNCTKITGIVP